MSDDQFLVLLGLLLMLTGDFNTWRIRQHEDSRAWRTVGLVTYLGVSIVGTAVFLVGLWRWLS